MRAAVVNRDLIGQAKGILMERHRITADAAFALLAEASEHKNVKLTEVAACLVETGELIGPPGPSRRTARLYRPASDCPIGRGLRVAVGSDRLGSRASAEQTIDTILSSAGCRSDRAGQHQVETRTRGPASRPE